MLVIFCTVITITFVILLISFPVGAYIVFNTGIGDNLTHEYPINFHYLVLPVPIPFTITLELGLSFAILWSIYLAVFTVGILGPVKHFAGALNDIIYNKTQVFWGRKYNYILVSIAWLGILLVATKSIDLVQSIFGISIGQIEFENYLVQFFELSAAPLREELGFRILLVGIPCLMILGNVNSIKDALIALWHPGRKWTGTSRHVYAVITLSSLLFGLSHLAFPAGWEIGKITQATIGGWILGYIYYRYGFPSALILHWASNYGIFTHGFFGYALYGSAWYSTEDNLLLAMLDILLTIIGIISIAFYLYHYSRKRFLKDVKMDGLA